MDRVCGRQPGRRRRRRSPCDSGTVACPFPWATRTRFPAPVQGLQLQGSNSRRPGAGRERPEPLLRAAAPRGARLAGAARCPGLPRLPAAHGPAAAPDRLSPARLRHLAQAAGLGSHAAHCHQRPNTGCAALAAALELPSRTASRPLALPALLSPEGCLPPCRPPAACAATHTARPDYSSLHGGSPLRLLVATLLPFSPPFWIALFSVHGHLPLRWDGPALVAWTLLTVGPPRRWRRQAGCHGLPRLPGDAGIAQPLPTSCNPAACRRRLGGARATRWWRTRARTGPWTPSTSGSAPSCEQHACCGAHGVCCRGLVLAPAIPPVPQTPTHR